MNVTVTTEMFGQSMLHRSGCADLVEIVNSPRFKSLESLEIECLTDVSHHFYAEEIDHDRNFTDQSDEELAEAYLGYFDIGACLLGATVRRY